MSPRTLFFSVCVPIRLFIAYGTYKLAAVGGIVGKLMLSTVLTMTAINLVVAHTQKRKGVLFGTSPYWNRPVHAVLVVLSLTAVWYSPKMVFLVLCADVAFGVYTFVSQPSR